MSDKRKGYITWDEYFMGVAKLSAMRSKDPSTQLGACQCDTMDFPRAAQIMNFHGEKEIPMSITTNMSM